MEVSDFRLDEHLAPLMGRLAELASSCDAVSLFCACTILLAFRPAEWLSESMHETAPAKVELLAWLLFPYFPGTSTEPPDPPAIEEMLRLTSEIFHAYSFIEPMARRRIEEDSEFATAMFLAESRARIVRGSAFPEQTADEILGIQGRFESKFRALSGIGPSQAVRLLWEVVKAEEEALNAAQADMEAAADELGQRWQLARRKLPADRNLHEQALLEAAKNTDIASMLGYASHLTTVSGQILPVRLESLELRELEVSPEEWDALIKLIGLTSEHIREMDDPITVQTRPLYVLPDRSVVLVDISTAFDALYTAYEGIAKQDDNFFSKSYQPFRAGWTQDKTRQQLLRLFPKQSLYTGLTYPDPDNQDSHGQAELDIAILWEPFLVLIEVKAHQFRTLAHASSPGRLFTDLKRNVQVAFEQGIRAKRYIDTTDTPRFVEKQTGRVLSITKMDIEEVYITSVTQHLLSESVTHVSNIRRVGLFGKHALPFCLSLGDLEVVATHCLTPDVFLHYIARRLDVANQLPATHAGELELFGTYLGNRLQLQGLWAKEKRDPDHVMLAGFSDAFDEYYMFQRGEIDRKPDIKLDVPPLIAQILGSLGKNDSAKARWIAFQLLDLPNALLDRLDKAIEEMDSVPFQENTFRTGVLYTDDIAIVMVISRNHNHDRIRDHMLARIDEEKYKRKASKGIGLAFCSTTRSCELIAATYDDSEWQHDPELEARIQLPRPSLLPPGHAEPPRNAPCPCGSGKKYKKCCLRSIEQARAEARKHKLNRDEVRIRTEDIR
jgi:hypothetical protein